MYARPANRTSRSCTRRWNVELDIRNIKTTMGMVVLHCQTAHMNEKEIWVHLLAYNVIRLLMAQAASHYATDPRTLNFKHTVQLWTEWLARGLTATHDQSLLFNLIAQCCVRNRPGRIEPRMRKRRPKSYPWLKEPRHIARERVRKYGHAPLVNGANCAATTRNVSIVEQIEGVLDQIDHHVTDFYRSVMRCGRSKRSAMKIWQVRIAIKLAADLRRYVSVTGCEVMPRLAVMAQAMR